MLCFECGEPCEGIVFRIVHDASGDEIAKICPPCEEKFCQDGFCTSLVEGEKSYKVETYRVVETIINQDFWVVADSEDEAEKILNESGFSESEDPSGQAGDEWHDPFSAITLDFNIANIEEG